MAKNFRIVGCMVLLLLGSILLAGAESTPRVLNGIDVLRKNNYDLIAGKRVGLITNHTGVAADGKTTIELLFESKVCELVAIFSPEHGVHGTRDGEVSSSTDESTSLPVYSLYGKTDRPTAEMLKNIELLIFDIQDVGARFYTYITTMAYCMEEAAKAGIPFYVLDRPNPIGGTQVEGPMLDPDRRSFTAYMPLPIRHGMTVGELARFFNTENKIGATLHVVEMEGWSREHLFWDTGQLWQNPSPNIRNMHEALLYPGICLLEFTNVSVGRGTDRPFETAGAPWINPLRFAAELRKSHIAGVEFAPVFFTPESGKYQGISCGGVHILITDADRLKPVSLGLSVIATLHRLYPDDFEIKNVLSLLGNLEAMNRLQAGGSPAEVLRTDRSQLREFMAKRQKALIY